MTNDEHRAQAERLLALAYLPKITAQDMAEAGCPVLVNTRQLMIELAAVHALMGMYPPERAAPKVRTGTRKMSGHARADRAGGSAEPKSSGS